MVLAKDTFKNSKKCSILIKIIDNRYKFLSVFVSILRND